MYTFLEFRVNQECLNKQWLGGRESDLFHGVGLKEQKDSDNVEYIWEEDVFSTMKILMI